MNELSPLVVHTLEGETMKNQSTIRSCRQPGYINDILSEYRDPHIHTLTVSVSGISVKMRSRLLSSLTDRLLKSWLALLMMGMAASGRYAAPD